MGGHSSGGLFPGAAGAAPGGPETGSGGGTISENGSGVSSPGAVSMRERLLDEAVTDEARGIVKELYRSNAETGDGGTADAIREQLRTGELVGGKDHIQKGRERLRQIEKDSRQEPQSSR